jgi:RNA polymerase sigma-70 factor (ECF subfamily)
MDTRLSKIDTLWSVVQRANDADSPDARTAQQKLWTMYSGAAKRYLLAALRNEDAADEVMQELGVKLSSNAFRNADPNKGSFRVFLKTCLFRMVADFRRKSVRNRLRHEIKEEIEVPEDGEFMEPWREELLTHAWIKLEAFQDDTEKPWHTVLRVKIDQPEMDSGQLAELASQKSGKEISSGNYRVLLHRAREKFAELLLFQVADSLNSPNADMLEEELAELQLLEICRTSFDSMKSSLEA